ncbi:MAG: aldo/keto reductase [Candidatus Brocadiia bacterium]
MQYAVLGRTGLKVSRLGFGAMRLPMQGREVDRDKTIPMIHRAFKEGVNYIDTAVMYCNGDSQRAVGEALQGWRDQIVVSTKNHYYNKNDDGPWWKNLEDSLRLLGVETIDIYNFHGLKWERFVDQVAGPDGMLAWMHKARDQGLIRHICFSFHDTAEALRKLAETREFDAVTLQYNLLDRHNEPALGACKKAGLGVVVMGPVGGGRLGSPSEAIQKMIPGARSVPEVALRFVLANPNVAVALSGMSEMKHVKENVRVASRKEPLGAREKRRVKAILNRYKKLADLYCTGCNYCMPCPSGVNIPRNFMLLNYARVYGLEDLAKSQYRRLEGKATQCVACGKCMDKCPQNIDIIAQLRETVRTLDDAYGKVAVAIRPTEVIHLSRSDGRLDAQLKARVECHNISDNDVSPELHFEPQEGVRVGLSRGFGQLGPFERRRATLTIDAQGVPEGQPLRLDPQLDAPLEMVCEGEPLAVAIAPRAAKRSPRAALGRAPLAAAQAARGEGRPSDRTVRSYALAARFAHNADALIVRFEAQGSFRRPPTEERRLRHSDRIWLRLDFRDGRKIRLPKKHPGRFDIALALEAEAGKAPPVRVMRPRMGREEAKKQIRVNARGRKGGRQVQVRIPWSLLQVKPPEPGASLGLRFAMVTYNHGKPWQLAWGESPGSTLLLAE